MTYIVVAVPSRWDYFKIAADLWLDIQMGFQKNGSPSHEIGPLSGYLMAYANEAVDGDNPQVVWLRTEVVNEED